MSVGRRMIMGAAGAFSLADINLASGEFTDGLAAAKGWVDFNTVTWQTSTVRLHTVLNQISFAGYIKNNDVILRPGTQYTYRAYLSAKTGSGSPTLSVAVFDSGGNIASTTLTTTGQWASVTFTPDEAVNDFFVSAYNATNTDSTVTVSAVQLFKT